MNTLKLLCTVLPTMLLLVACDIEIGDSDANEPDSTSMVYQLASGTQTDIFHQRTDVIQDAAGYYELMASIPTMSDFGPEFNPDTDTLVSIISNAVSCYYYPRVEGVYDELNTIIIELENIRVKNPETCDPTGEQFYSYKFVKIDKTHKPISIMIRNEG
jgi:hypothetical protein